MTLWTKYKGQATLALLLVVTPLVVWQYAVSGTVTQWRATAKARRQIIELHASQPRSVDTSDVSTAGSEMILSGAVVAELLPLIENEGLWIAQFSPCVTSEADGILLTTGQLTIEGHFAGIVQLLDRIETDLPECKLISAHYRTTKPRTRNAIKTLNCTIYIQQITTKK
ncbi:MAG: hypothetical protein LBR57_02100 [Alistipes sp.]|nr:hypothetical protein [Alistipes sp.]